MQGYGEEDAAASEAAFTVHAAHGEGGGDRVAFTLLVSVWLQWVDGTVCANQRAICSHGKEFEKRDILFVSL